MSLGRSIDHWGTNPGDLIDAALTAIETALQELLARSEEHTSELQSLADLVCRLLLEKKKRTHV